MKNELSPTPRLVFMDVEDKEPYTTDEIIAACAQVKRSTVTRLIKNHLKELESFGLIGFEIRKPTAFTAGGRPEKLYHLNEQQATLLITFIRNTAPVISFKKALVKEFFDMKKEIAQFKELRAGGKVQRKSLTDMIRDNPKHNKWDYKLYTDLAYKAAFGKSAAQIKRERAPGSELRSLDLLSADELDTFQKYENLIAVLYSLGRDYESIKAAVSIS